MSNTQVCSQTGEPAIFHYRWEWGEEGFASQTGRQLLEQTAKNLRRPKGSGNAIEFNLLPDDGQPKPMELEERARMLGRILALEEELRLKAEKNVEQHNQLTTTKRDLRIAEVQKGSLETQLADAAKSVGLLQNEVQDAKRLAVSWEEKAIHFQALVTGEGAQAVKDLTVKVEELESANATLRADLEKSEARRSELEAELSSR